MPAKIHPAISMNLVGTYDIFMTMISMANATEYLPNDGRVYDGKDMSDLLFGNNKQEIHECIYMYGGTPNDTHSCPYQPNDTQYPKCAGLWAVRCGHYKVHWITAHNSSVVIQDPPLLYNVDIDPSELHPIWPNNVAYNETVAYVTQKRDEHLQTLQRGIPNQMAKGSSSDNYLCADPNSQSKYPQYPNCTLSPENWKQFTCQPVCYATDQCNATQPGLF